jgi:hypothetical protein
MLKEVVGAYFMVPTTTTCQDELSKILTNLRKSPIIDSNPVFSTYGAKLLTSYLLYSVCWKTEVKFHIF